jgi:hypothetical protein
VGIIEQDGYTYTIPGKLQETLPFTADRANAKPGQANLVLGQAAASISAVNTTPGRNAPHAWRLITILPLYRTDSAACAVLESPRRENKIYAMDGTAGRYCSGRIYPSFSSGPNLAEGDSETQQAVIVFDTGIGKPNVVVDEAQADAAAESLGQPEGWLMIGSWGTHQSDGTSYGDYGNLPIIWVSPGVGL